MRALSNPLSAAVLAGALLAGCGLGGAPSARASERAHASGEHASGEHTIDAVRSDAMERYEAGDYAVFVDLMEAVAENSGSDVDDYNLACGYALAGQQQQALEKLRFLVARGSTFDMANDSDFDSLRGNPEFHRLLGEIAFHEEADRRLEPVRDLAMRAYHAGRYREFVEIMERVVEYSHNDVDVYNLACGHALMRHGNEAIAHLEFLADKGVDFGAASDADFDPIRSDPRFQAVLVRFAAAD
jgi:hypothetical protein